MGRKACLTYHTNKTLRGLPLITYAPRGGGGVKTNAYKCVQGGRGGMNMTKNTHFVRRENATISKTYRPHISAGNSLCSCKFHFMIHC